MRVKSMRQAQKTAIKRLETIKNKSAIVVKSPDTNSVIVSFSAPFYGVYKIDPRGKTERLERNCHEKL